MKLEFFFFFFCELGGGLVGLLGCVLGVGGWDMLILGWLVWFHEFWRAEGQLV